MNKVIHVFQNVDMRNQHDGLTALALKKKINLKALPPGEHVVFINANVNKIKVYSPDGTPDGVLSYKRKTDGVINLGMIEELPRCMGSDGKFNLEKAEKLAIERNVDRALGKAKK